MFAVPGSPLDPRSEGTNALLKQGAIMVTEAEAVLAVLRPIVGHRPELPEPGPRIEDDGAPLPEPSADARARIVALLGPTPVSADDLIRLSGASTTAVQTTLLELELAGRLKRQTCPLLSITIQEASTNSAISSLPIHSRPATCMPYAVPYGGSGDGQNTPRQEDGQPVCPRRELQGTAA